VCVNGKKVSQKELTSSGTIGAQACSKGGRGQAKNQDQNRGQNGRCYRTLGTEKIAVETRKVGTNKKIYQHGWTPERFVRKGGVHGSIKVGNFRGLGAGGGGGGGVGLKILLGTEKW